MKSIDQIQNVCPRCFTIPGLFCLCMIICLVTLSCNREKQEVKEEVVRPVKMVTITTSTDALKRKFPGVVRAAKRADLSFQVPGTLKELPVEEGKRIQEGQLVARLDQRDFENNLRNAQGQLSRVQAAVAGAQSEYDRILRIQEQDPGAASESMVVRRRQLLDQAKADIESVQAAVDAAKDRLGYTTLEAPFSGVISKRYADNFQEVLAKQTIVSLDDISSLEILVEVPEIIMASLKETTEREERVHAHAEFAAAPGKEFPLTVKEFSARADAKTQTYQIVLEMERPKQGVNILPGMTATVVGKPPAQTPPEGFSVIPAVAVFADDRGDSNVWVVEQENMTVSRRKVLTGDLTGQESIQINQGLETGEMIAVSGVSRLREGMKVRPFDGTF